MELMMPLVTLAHPMVTLGWGVDIWVAEHAIIARERRRYALPEKEPVWLCWKKCRRCVCVRAPRHKRTVIYTMTLQRYVCVKYIWSAKTAS